MRNNLVAQDGGTREDQKGRRNKQRPEDLRSGTLHGQYQLRGSILVIKDNLNPISGFLSFGTDITTAPMTAAAGSGLFIDYTGLALLNGNTLLVRTGNLNGTYGYVTDVYGFATGQYGAAGKVSVTIEQTNGIRFILNTDVIAQWDLSGNITIGKVLPNEFNIYLTASSIELRVDTDPIISLSNAGIATDRGFGFAPVSFSLTSGDIDLDDGGNAISGALFTSYIHITSASGDLNIRSIVTPLIAGQHLVVQNHSAHAMTIEDNGTPVSGAYNNIRTGDGHDWKITAGGLFEVIYNNIEDRWDVKALGVGWAQVP